MKKLILCFFIFLAFGNNTFAQEEISDDYKNAVKKMLQLAGSESTFKVALEQMIQLFKQQKSQVPESVWDELSIEFSKVSIDDLMNMLVPVYHKHFTIDDIKQLIAFYESPIGKKYAEKTPLISKESMQAGADWGRLLGQKVVERLKEKGY